MPRVASICCPCGYCGDPVKECSCTPSMISRYKKRISGTLLDRIDIYPTTWRFVFKKEPLPRVIACLDFDFRTQQFVGGWPQPFNLPSDISYNKIPLTKVMHNSLFCAMGKQNAKLLHNPPSCSVPTVHCYSLVMANDSLSGVRSIVL